jgi:hypothetical protein
MATRGLFQQYNTDPTRSLSVSSNNSQVNDIDNYIKWRVGLAYGV